MKFKLALVLMTLATVAHAESQWPSVQDEQRFLVRDVPARSRAEATTREFLLINKVMTSPTTGQPIAYEISGTNGKDFILDSQIKGSRDKIVPMSEVPAAMASTPKYINTRVSWHSFATLLNSTRVGAEGDLIKIVEGLRSTLMTADTKEFLTAVQGLSQEGGATPSKKLHAAVLETKNGVTATPTTEAARAAREARSAIESAR